MKKTNLLLIILILNVKYTYSQENFLSTKISVECENSTIRNVINELSTTYDIRFSYKSDISGINNKVSLSLHSKTLKYVLGKLFSGTNIRYVCYSNQIILTEAEISAEPLVFVGTVVDVDTREPVSFATLKIKNENEYVIAGSNGEFELEIERNIPDDTLVVYAFSYQKIEFPVTKFMSRHRSVIFLSKKDFNIDTISVKPRGFSIKDLGNGGVFSSGSMYIDTHGQQTALFIENENSKEGTILKLKYKLSDKGNVYAPFRIRIYAPDKDNKPGEDILEDIIIVKPENTQSWFEVDVSAYNISLPATGFFVGIEGVYPHNFESFYAGSEFENISEYTQNITEYGQRISFNKRKQNNTWHYSLSHTWFKTDKKRFNVMIKAEVRFYDN